MEANKDEAEKCFHISQKQFELGNKEKALKFAQRAYRLYPSQQYKGKLFTHLVSQSYC